MKKTLATIVILIAGTVLAGCSSTKVRYSDIVRCPEAANYVEFQEQHYGTEWHKHDISFLRTMCAQPLKHREIVYIDDRN